MIAGLGSNGFASISSELFEILKESLDVVKYLKVLMVTEGIDNCVGDVEVMIVDGVDNLLISISW